MPFQQLKKDNLLWVHCEKPGSYKVEESKCCYQYIKQQVGTVRVIGTIWIDLTSVDKLFGDRFIYAKIDQYH